jgi:hypothetical protein
MIGFVCFTLTSLSQPADTISGSFWFGLKRTHETQSVWLSSTIVYLPKFKQKKT